MVYCDPTEAQTTRLANGGKTAIDDNAEEFLEATTVDRADPQSWSDAPDLVEGNNGKFASPIKRNTRTIETSHQSVAEIFTKVETNVRT